MHQRSVPPSAMMNNVVKYDWIDLLRGTAILMVIFVHSAQNVSGLGSVSSSLAGFGQMGVQLFFVASAITLCLSVKSRGKTEKHPVLYFYLRRYFRIAPVYYLGIFLYLLLSMLSNHNMGKGFHVAPQYNVRNVLANFFLIHSFCLPATNSIVPGGWSIGTEVAFYVIFPLLFWSMEHLERHRIALVLSLTGICGGFELAMGLLGHHWIYNNGFEFYSLLNQLPVFLIGMFAYFRLNARLHARGESLLLALVGTLALACALALWLHPVRLAFFAIPIFCAIAFSAIALFLASHPFTMPQWLLYVGRRSYSIYLVHFLCLYFIQRITNYFGILTTYPVLNLILHFLLAVAASYLLAGLTEKIIERKGIRLGRTIIANLEVKAVQSEALSINQE